MVNGRAIMFLKGRVMKQLILVPVLVFLFCFSGCVGIFSSEKPLFMNPPEYVGVPDAEHAATNRAFQGIPSLAAAPGGRLWATWYAGKTPGEDQNNYIVLGTSSDNGVTWREVLIVDPDGEGPVRAFDPEVWMAPDGNLRLTWSQDIRGCPDGTNYGHDGSVSGVWVLEITNTNFEKPEWKKPVRATDGIMMCKPLVLSTGEWVLPVSTWKTTDNSAKMVVSSDQGKTWMVRGACNVPVQDRNFDEHMFVERKDGSLWMLLRTNYGIGESVSQDRGETWSALLPSEILHTPARFFISRLNSGNLLL
ncbi:MAG: sialidase family protein, partial [Verrucomicrobiota bacterium]|nr:sialidase family protein [Verrucomicrobiota bacterium]